MGIHDDGHWPGMSTRDRRAAAVRTEARRVGDASIPLRRIASRVAHDDRELAAILFSSAAICDAAGRDLVGLSGELVGNLGRLADAVERVAGAGASVDAEPSSP